MQKHLFILDKQENLDFAKDTSLRLAAYLQHLSRKTINIYFCEITDIFCSNANQSPVVNCKVVNFTKINPIFFNVGEKIILKLEDFNVIHMRKDPPVDDSYITTTWMLSMVSDKVKILNHPQALRDFNEKLSILRYPKYCRPTLVSADPQRIFEFFQKEANYNAVLKPLFNCAGEGVIHLNGNNISHKKILSWLRRYIKKFSFIMIQPFEQRVFEGEVRAFTVGGRPLVWCLKKPKKGQFLTNSNYGSIRLAYRPKKQEYDMVQEIAEDLKKYGVEIIGFDILAGFVSEINITSPRLLIPQSSKHDYHKDFAKWVIQNCF